MEQKHYFESLMSNMETRWEQQCMTNLGEIDSYTYKSLATTIARLHAQFKVLGIEEGDRIALAGRNCTNWGVAFLAITSYKAVVVSILPDFTGDDIEKLVTHSGAKLLFVGPNVKNKIHPEQIDCLLGTVFMDEWNMYNAKEEKTIESYTKAGTDFDKQYPDGITFAQVNYPTDNLNDLAIINYTSGSTGTPKGVMLTNLSLSANVNFAIRMIPHKPGDTVLSMLPIAHMFGLMFEFLYQICDGTPIFFLTTAPTPSTLMKALAEVKPFMILTVPLVIEKIIRKSVFPVIQKPYMRILWHTPIVKNILRKKVKERLMTAFGNRLRHLILGGAALNEEVETCLKEMKMPYCVGYGMTECGPLLAYADWRIYQPRSCGKAIDCMKFRIMSSSPENQEGELQVKGDCIMTGYYHNEQATKEAFTEDGWMRTGDLGIIDKDGNLFLRGRSKNMILSASGQNIYPEEIEDKVNNLNEVTESLVVDRDGKIIALIYPQDTLLETLSKEDLQNTLTEAIHKVNEKLPKYSQISAIEVRTEPFLKTPKQSIKRYLYK